MESSDSNESERDEEQMSQDTNNTMTLKHSPYTPQQLCLSLYITNWSLPSAISKSPVCASSTSLLHLTLWIITSSSSDFNLGSASLALLYSGSNPICPLDHSLLKPAATHLNPSHSPVVSLKALSRVHSFSSCIPPH